MTQQSKTSLDQLLNAAKPEELERRIVEVALERTNAQNGGLFLWDDGAQALRIDFHLVAGLHVRLPNALMRRRTDGRPNGIALWVLDNNRSYLCRDTVRDPNYAPYFVDVGSIAAVPVPYQGRPIGVLSVSRDEPGALSEIDLEALETLASLSAKFLRRAQLHTARSGDGGRPFLIKGMSPQWLEVESRIEQVSPTDAPVLIFGESGTGKELVANAIHFNSRRSAKPFVTVNCAAIPETMLESILFGHVRGAFTGASFTKVGELQKAHGGTLFLDEVGELPIALQAKLLRAIEQGEIQPLGSNEPPKRVDVRVICATNRDLAAMAAKETFRKDLYYRLSVMTMELPPLRSYKDNLPVLAHVFLEQHAQKLNRAAPRITEAAMALLRGHDYPGNVRELKNAIEHAMIMARGDRIQPEDLPRAMRRAPSPAHRAPAPCKRRGLREMRELWLEPLERQYLGELLRDCDGNVREAAALAGVNTVTMYRLIKKRGIELRREVCTS